ncbi:MAG: CBS domain-containing protein [Bdellovibrionaceae bacterium]|nr:CBS domain-containing protein [Pseudobdellovibrionaceae bacterium]
MDSAIGSYMVKSPYVGDGNWSLKEALAFLMECEFRHLPIVAGGRLVGVVSERDLRAAAALPQASQLTVGDIMKQDVFVATRQTSLRQVLRTMQERKLGSTVIINDERAVIGIFTVTDALRILVDLLSDDEGDDLLVDEYFEVWESRGPS